MRPGLEELVLEVDFGDLFNVGHVKQVSHGAIGSFEVADLIQHLLVVLISPVRRHCLFIRGGRKSKLNDNVPTNSVAGDGEGHPLPRSNTTGTSGKIRHNVSLQGTLCKTLFTGHSRQGKALYEKRTRLL